MTQRKKIQCVLGFFGTFEHSDNVGEDGGCLNVFLVLESALGEVELVVVVSTLLSLLVFAAAGERQRSQYDEKVISHL